MVRFLVIISAFIFVFGCRNDDDATPENTPPDESVSVDEFISGLSIIPTGTSIDSPEHVGATVHEWDENSGVFCTSKKYKLGPAYSEGFILTPTNDVIFPGAILDGNSIYDGGYRLISLARTGGVISTDNIGATSVAEEVEETTKSDVQQGVADILNKALSGSSGAQINFQVDDIQSEEQLDIALGYSMGMGEKLEIKAGMNFEKDSKKSRVLVKFQQIYYTITYDAKNRPSQYFQESVQAKDVYNALDGSKTAPVYVSNVKYGRVAYYSISSTMSQQELKLTLNAQLNLASTQHETDNELTQKLSNAETEISGTIIGGSGEDAVGSVISLDNFFNYITQGGEYTANSPGLPIAYTLRRISDNAVFTVQKTTEYVVRECQEVNGAISLNELAHYSGPDTDRLKGNVTMSIGYDGSNEENNSQNTLWNSPDRIHLPQNGTSTPLPAPQPVNITYNPERFEEAYMNISVDFNNMKPYEGMGPRNANYYPSSDKIATYRIYLKDIENPQQLQQPWSTSDGQTFYLQVNMPESCDYANHCTKERWYDSYCQERYNDYVCKPESSIRLSFSININHPNNL